MAERSIQRILIDLESVDAIHIERRPGKENVYQINIEYTPATSGTPTPATGDGVPLVAGVPLVTQTPATGGTPALSSYKQRRKQRREEPSATASGVMATFERFWNSYPKKRGRGTAERAWRRIRPDADLIDQILAAVEVQQKLPRWTKERGEYVPYPGTWLNAKGWLDEDDKNGDHGDVDMSNLPTDEDFNL